MVGHYLEKDSTSFFAQFLVKAPKYLFHIIALGRYYPDGIKNNVYAFCNSVRGMSVFAGLLVLYYGVVLLRIRKMSVDGKMVALLVTWILAAIGIVSLLAFPDMQLVLFDRYAYFTMPFVYVLLLYFITRIPFKAVWMVIFAGYALVNLRFSVMVNDQWKQSSRVISGLMESFPDPKGRTVLLLNPPENMNGLLMRCSGPDSKFKMMYNFEQDKKIDVPVYDVASYNMLTPNDGAHIMVVYDSVMHVTLNQWGTWWWYGYHGAVSYENEEYKLNMIDVGHWYELTLKHPADHYLLLYQSGDKWKAVDWNNKNKDQY